MFRKCILILIVFLCAVSGYSATQTDNINNYVFGQTVTLHNVTFKFLTNAPSENCYMRISGIGSSKTNWYYSSGNVETDPVFTNWNATNTYLKSFIESDPVWTNWLATQALFTVWNVASTNASSFTNWVLTNTYIKVEVDPVFTNWNETNTYIKVETDPVFTNWNATNTYLKSYNETDPVFTNWHATNTYIKIETDPVFTNWNATNTYLKSYIETDPIFATNGLKLSGGAITGNVSIDGSLFVSGIISVTNISQTNLSLIVTNLTLSGNMTVYGNSSLASGTITRTASASNDIVNYNTLTNYSSTNYYPLVGNPSNYVTAAITNNVYPLNNPSNYVTQAVTNGLYPSSNPNGYVTSTITNLTTVGDVSMNTTSGPALLISPSGNTTTSTNVVNATTAYLFTRASSWQNVVGDFSSFVSHGNINLSLGGSATGALVSAAGNLTGTGTGPISGFRSVVTNTANATQWAAFKDVTVINKSLGTAPSWGFFATPTLTSEIDYRPFEYISNGVSRFKVNQAGVVNGSGFLPISSNLYDLGSSTLPFRDLYLGTNSIYMDNVKVLSYNSATTTLVVNVSMSNTNGIQYILTETDPVFTNWNATNTYLKTYTEIDPVFTNWNATNTYLKSYTEADPIFATNGVKLSDTNGWVVSSHAGFVDQTITNGLYPSSNPANYVDRTITNGLVSSANTNGWVVSSHAGFVDQTITNGLYPSSNPNGYVTQTITNGLVSSANTNGWVVSSHSTFVDQTITNGLYPSSNPSGYVTQTITNGLERLDGGNQPATGNKSISNAAPIISGISSLRTDGWSLGETNGILSFSYTTNISVIGNVYQLSGTWTDPVGSALSLHLDMETNTATQIVDVSPAKNHATIYPNLATGPSSYYLGNNSNNRMEYARTFDSYTKYLTLTNSPLLDPKTNYTMSAWLYPFSYPTAGQEWIVKIDYGTAGTPVSVFSIEIDGTSQCFLRDGASQTLFITTPAALPLNTWTMVTFVKAGSVLSVYTNGIFGRSATNNSLGNVIVSTAGSDAPIIGGYPISGPLNNFRLDGRLDELREYYDTSLTAVQVATLYTNTLITNNQEIRLGITVGSALSDVNLISSRSYTDTNYISDIRVGSSNAVLTFINMSLSGLFTNGLSFLNYFNNGIYATNWIGTNTHMSFTTNLITQATNTLDIATALRDYPRSNPSNYVTQTITNGLYPSSNPNNYVDRTITNGLYPSSNPAGYITQAGTNGLASIVYTTNLVTQATNILDAAIGVRDYPRNNPSNYVTASITNGLYPSSNPNGYVTQTVTNGLASIIYTTNLVTTSTNGFVTASITNGLYPSSNPSGYVTQTITNGLASIVYTTNLITTATNGLVTSSVTNGLYPSSNPSGYVTATITNGLASIIYTTNLVTTSTNTLDVAIGVRDYPRSNPSNYVTQTITNGLYPSSNPSGYVTQTVTNGLASIVYTTNLVTTSTNGLVTASVTNGLYPSSNPNNYVDRTVTNGLYPSSNPAGYITTTGTNGLASITYTTNLVTQATNTLDTAIVLRDYPRSNPSNYVTASITNGLYPSSNPSGYVTQTVTNGLYPSSNPSGYVTATITNGLASIIYTTNLVTVSTNTLDAATILRDYPRSNPSNYVTQTITNGLYPSSNPSGYVTQTVTNGLVTAAITNGLYPSSNPSGYVTQTVTNGLASIIYTTNLVTVATNTLDVATAVRDYPRSNPSNYVTASVTNGLYSSSNPSGYVTQTVTNGLYPSSNPSGYVTQTVTNGLASIIYTTNLVTGATNTLDTAIALRDYPRSNPSNYVTATITNGLYPSSNPSGYVTQTVTNGLYPSSNPSGYVTQTVTNGLTSIIYTTNLVTTSTNTLDVSIAVRDYPRSNPSNYVTASITNGLYPSSNPSGFLINEITGNWSSNSLTNVWALTKDITGFAYDTDNEGVFSFDATNRILKLSNTVPFQIFWNSQQFINTNQITFPAIGTNSGLWYLYYNAGNASSQVVSQTSWSLDNAQVATVYWGGGTSTVSTVPVFAIGQETHGFMPWNVHRRFHMVDGSKYADGLSLQTTNAIVFTNTSGNWLDEDILHYVAQSGISRVIWRTNSVTTFSIPQLQYTITNGAAQGLMYDNAGNLAQVPTGGGGQYVNYWIYTAPDASCDYVSVAGRLVSATLATVTAENPYDLTGLMPYAESILIYQITLRNSNPPTVAAVKDYRKSQVTGTSYSPTVHSTLTGRDAAGSHPATAISTDTSLFTNLLTSSETDVQLALNKLVNPVWVGNATSTLSMAGYNVTNAGTISSTNLLVSGKTILNGSYTNLVASLTIGTPITSGTPADTTVLIAKANPKIRLTSNDADPGYGGYIRSTYTTDGLLALGTVKNSTDTEAITMVGAKVGIGTNAPATTLDVNGNSTFRGSIVQGISTTTNLFLADTNTFSGWLSLGTPGLPTRPVDIYSGSDSIIRIRRSTANSETMDLVAARGGLSGANNQYSIDLISSAITFARPFKIRRSIDGGSSYADYLNVYTNGFIGIGSIIPATLLDVNGASTFRGTADHAGNNITNAGIISTTNLLVSGTSTFGNINMAGNTLDMQGGNITNAGTISSSNLISGGAYISATSQALKSLTAGSGTTPATAPIAIQVINDNTTGSNFAFYGFSDTTTGGNTFGALGMCLRDHANNYGDIVAVTRDADGYLERFRITSVGNVGIGTTTPSAKLHITGGEGSSTYTAATIALGYSTAGTYPHFIHTRHNSGGITRNAIDFYTCDSTAAGIFPNNAIHNMTMEGGLVGIGTNIPATTLDVNGGSTLRGSVSQTSLTGTNSFVGRSYFSRANIDSGHIILGTSPSASGFGVFDYNAFGDGVLDSMVTLGNSYDSAASGMRFGMRLNGTAVYPLVLRGTGNVGIGTNAPVNKLDIFNSGAAVAVKIFSDGTGTTHDAKLELRVQSATSGDAFVRMTETTSGRSWLAGMDNSDSQKYKISVADTLGTGDKFIIDTAGKIGIGTNIPATTLDVNGTTTLRGDATLINNSTFYTLQMQGNGSGDSSKAQIIQYGSDVGTYTGRLAILQNLGSGNYRENLTILNSSGNVGIGTNVPGYKLHVKGVGTATAISVVDDGIFQIRDTAAGGNTRMEFWRGASQLGMIGTPSSIFTVVGQGNSDIKFNGATDGSAGTEWMRLKNATGYLGIGTNAPATTLDVNGASTFRGAMNLTGNSITNIGTISTTNLLVSGSVTVTAGIYRYYADTTNYVYEIYDASNRYVYCSVNGLITTNKTKLVP